MGIYYKTLFEIKIFHEYYLTDPDGTNVFDKNLQADRLAFLLERFVKGEPGINEELAYTVPRQAEALFRNQKLRLLPTYGGFKVAIEVVPETLGDGTKVYRPKVPLTDDTAMPVLLMKKNSRIDAYTNGRMSRDASAVFYFSNEVYSGAKVHPFLSNNIPLLSPTYAYEQGELADHGANTIRAFYRDSGGTIRWLSRNGTGYANESDRLLVPPGFYYSFGAAGNVTDAAFTLRDAGGNVLSSYTFSQPAPIARVYIPVRAEDVLTVPESAPSPQLLNTLEVTGSNGYSRTLRLMFYGGTERIGDSLGLVHIKVRTANNNFDLLDASGLLIMRRKPDGTYNPGNPVFEIRLRSRIAFWRYINERKNDFQNNLHPDQLELQGGKLVSKEPRSLSYGPQYFRKPDNSLYYLPTPTRETLRSEGDRIYSDIYVSESKDFFPSGP